MISSRPTSQQLLDKMWQCIRQKDYQQAIASCDQLTRTYPDFAPGWYAANHLAQLIKQPDTALYTIERALKLEPGNRDWQLQRAGCLIWQGNTSSAQKALNRLRREITVLDTPHSAQLMQLAFLYSRLDMYKEAQDLYMKLIELEPQTGSHWYNLAAAQRFSGQTTQAEANLDQAISLDGKNYAAYALRSDLRKQTPQSNHVVGLEKLLDQGIKSPVDKIQICYTLAKELEDIGKHAKSYSVLHQGADLRRKHMNYSPETDLQTMVTIKDAFNNNIFDGRIHGHPDKSPIFIIGLPRTGTTLVERILGSHSKIFAAGELNNFNSQIMKQIALMNGNQQLSGSQLVYKTTELNFQKLGEDYVASTRPQTGLTPHFVDKMPLNFLYAGLIHLALPNARIIHLTRHPMDTGYAIYKRLFQDAYPWSYDLSEIAGYYLAYRRLMDHWLNVMPGVIYEVAYEDLVHAIEPEARKLVKYCGLDWEPQCARFHENKAVSTTASASQVRQPVYQSSVNRWKDYQQQLSPLKQKLRDSGIVVD